MSRYENIGTVLSGTAQGSTSSVCSAPIILQPKRKALPGTAGRNQNAILVPGSGTTRDFLSLMAETVVTGQAGTSPTLTTTIEGTFDFMDNNTTLTNGITSSATTIALAARDGIAQFDYVLLVAADGSYSEWVQVTSSTTTGAGNHTIVRGLFGTTGQAFSSGDFLFFTRSWTAVPTPNATTTTLTTGATAISSATATAPVVATIDSQGLGMTRIPFPILRVKTSVGGSATPTATYSVKLGGLLQQTEGVRAR